MGLLMAYLREREVRERGRNRERGKKKTEEELLSCGLGQGKEELVASDGWWGMDPEGDLVGDGTSSRGTWVAAAEGLDGSMGQD